MDRVESQEVEVTKQLSGVEPKLDLLQLKLTGRYEEALHGYAKVYARALSHEDNYLASLCFEQMLETIWLASTKESLLAPNSRKTWQSPSERFFQDQRVKLIQLIREQCETFDAENFQLNMVLAIQKLSSTDYMPKRSRRAS